MPLEESWVSTGHHSTASRVSSTPLVGIPQLTEGLSLVRSCVAPARSGIQSALLAKFSSMSALVSTVSVPCWRSSRRCLLSSARSRCLVGEVLVDVCSRQHGLGPLLAKFSSMSALVSTVSVPCWRSSRRCLLSSARSRFLSEMSVADICFSFLFSTASFLTSCTWIYTCCCICRNCPP